MSTADTIVLLAPGVPHDYAASNADGPWDFHWAHFVPRPHWLSWLQQFPQSAPGFCLFSIADSPLRPRLRQAWERLLQENHQFGAYQEDLALNALEEVLLLLTRFCAHDSRRNLDPRIEQVLQQLPSSLSDPPSVAQLADLVALSPSRLAHLFKAETGESLAATLLKLRLRHAARLLECTELQMNEIACQTGFQSPFHFSRQFKRSYGVSPAFYRARRL